jgi:ferrochelatase
MPTSQSLPSYEHGFAENLGILLVNLGTPDAPTPSAVRRYLAEFLWDPHVIDIARPLWWLMLHGFVLRVRPARSARAYSKIWTDEGSPLLVHSTDIAVSLRALLGSQDPGGVPVALGMSYGKPSLSAAIDELEQAGAGQIVVLPLYPQYSTTTTASVRDAVSTLLSEQHPALAMHFISDYHDAPGYIAALANSIRECWDQRGRGEHLLLSFHGIPERTVANGDPYQSQCVQTAKLLAQSLQLRDNEWTLSFQSRVGRAEWLRPYTEDVIRDLGSNNIQSLDVVCPGFAADCLETLEEIAMQNAALFSQSGGGTLNYIPALNARADHIEFLSRLVEQVAGAGE